MYLCAQLKVHAVKRSIDITYRLRQDLMDTYRKVYPHCFTQREAWEKVARHPAPRFYISPKQAHDILRLMVRGDNSVVNKMTPRRQRMYHDLFEKLQELQQRKQFIGKSLWYICQFLVVEPAPEFYMSPVSVNMIFINYKKYGKNYEYSKIYQRKKRKK